MRFETASARRCIRWLALGLVAMTLASCSGARQPAATAAPAPIIAQETASATVAPATSPTAQPAGGTPAAGGNQGLPELPEAFRFQVLLRPANAPTGPDTEITGVYRAGAWQQTAHTGMTPDDIQSPAQETVAISGTTYTRPVGEPLWTRWPGMSFDAAYGLISPFTVLRLFAMADQKVRGEAEPVPGVGEPTYRTQALVSAETIKRVAQAGAAAVAPDADTQRTLMEQVAPLAVPQTVAYWANEQGRVYRAAATLLTADRSGAPAPWMQVTWRFWAYNDASLVVHAPQNFRDAAGPTVQSQPEPTAGQGRGLALQANLTVRVFASPGVPADDLAVTIYPAGDTRQPIDWRNQAEAQFALPPGRYDVLVQMDYAQEWLRGVDVAAGASLTRDVTFDFGTLKLEILRDGKPVTVDVVTYPAGDRQNWVDWRSDNPATIRLRAGVYDVEIAYDDYKSRQTVTGLQVRAGETTSQTVTLTP